MKTRTEVLIRLVDDEIRRVSHRLAERQELGLDNLMYLVNGVVNTHTPAGGVKEIYLELTIAESVFVLDLVEKHLEEAGHSVTKSPNELKIVAKR